MKRFTAKLLILAVTATAPVYAQQKTLFADGVNSHGGFGSTVTKVTQFNGETVVLNGIRGGWIIYHNFSLGFGGYGLTERANIPESARSLYRNTDGSLRDMRLIFGYGGLEAEYTGRWEDMIHYTAGLLVDAGNVEYAEHNDNLDNGDAIPGRNGSDLWYSLGFGMSEMVFVHAISEIAQTDMSGYIPQE